MSIVIDLDDQRTMTTLAVAGVGPVVVHSARGESALGRSLKDAVGASAPLVADGGRSREDTSGRRTVISNLARPQGRYGSRSADMSAERDR